MPGVLIVLVVVALVVVAVPTALVTTGRVRVVPAGHVGVLLRDGTYDRMVTAGLLWLPPGASVSVVASTEQDVDAEVALDGLRGEVRVRYRVDDPVRFLAAVSDASYAVEREAVASLRDFAAARDTDALLAGNAEAADHVTAAMTPRLRRWGIVLVRVEVVVHRTA